MAESVGGGTDISQLKYSGKEGQKIPGFTNFTECAVPSCMCTVEYE